nr:MAG TPA: hypothetical protein [Caudoviricetes sp.]
MYIQISNNIIMFAAFQNKLSTLKTKDMKDAVYRELGKAQNGA